MLKLVRRAVKLCSQTNYLSSAYSLNRMERKLYSIDQRSSQNIFDRDAKKWQKDRAAKDPEVALYDYLKDEVGYHLADRIFDLSKEIKVAADIGCGRGHVSKNVLAESVQHLYLCDSSPKMLEQAEGTPGLKITKLEMDEEVPTFEENSLDLVVSNLSLHWVNDLPGCFRTILNSLKPDGVFIASIFGGDTLFELRCSLQLAEMERKGGLAPHISPFTQTRDIGGLLSHAGFTLLTIDTDEIVIEYPSMYELMWDLKGMAESNAAYSRPLHLGRDTMAAAAAIYDEMYRKERGISATFQIIFFVGWKPGPNQPKPLERGTGEMSLKDLGLLFDKDGKSIK